MKTSGPSRRRRAASLRVWGQKRMVLDRAVEVFARGFAFTRSFAHPYLAQRVGPLWLLRDGPRSSGDLRTEEWIAHDAPPAEVHRIVRGNAQGRFAISVICNEPGHHTELCAAYKALGYRLRTSEFFMMHPLERIPAFAAPEGIQIERVMTQERADRLAKAARRRQILGEHFVRNSPLRQYVASADNRPVGWVRSITVEEGGRWTWCSSMFVLPKFRRRGIASALLSRMLQDDRSAGAEAAILLSSHTGAKLYPIVGYQLIGKLFLFSPKKS
jgi:GNAT superfamily N-acetyltransferase